MFSTAFTFQSFGLSDVGLVRDHNEDAFAIVEEKAVFLVADGMGGHKAGEVAAEEAVSGFSRLVLAMHEEKFKSTNDIIAFFRDSVETVNQSIYEKGQSPEFSGMGTTLSVLYLLRDQVLVVHVGDSRAYRLTKGKLHQLTIDHTLINELRSLGVISQREAENFPYRHVLTRAIGTNPHVEPTIQFHALQSQDILLLCTDGLTNYVSATEIEKILCSKQDLQTQGELLIEKANQHGGGDNITAILVEVI